MVNVLRCTQVFFTQSLLRPDVKHNARTSNVKMLKTFLILAPMHVPFRAERARRLTGLLADRGQSDFRECCPLRTPAP
jgi:hypothetical protein